MTDDITYEEHVQQNNQRLASIKFSLSDKETFPSACSELTQWCGDQRAFSSCFEENLLAALQVAVENATRDGFDFVLAHQLVTACFTHRKLLSKNNAGRINRWYEQFRRLKKNGGKKKKKAETQTVVLPLPVDLCIEGVTKSGLMWQSAGPMVGPSPLQSPSFAGPPGAQIMQSMQGYAMQPSPYPMDPAGARPQQYPIPDQNTMFDQNTMQYNHQQRMMMMQQAQVRARRAQAMTLHQQSTPAFDPIYQGVPMGVNNVPGQSQPLMRYPSGPMQSPNYMVPNAARAQQATGQQIGSPAYPPNNPQMIRAGPPMLFGQMQQQLQQQPVVSYPNPNVPPDSRQFNVPYVAEAVPTVVSPKEIIMRQFDLEHNATNHRLSFNLRPDIIQQLQHPFMDIQLKSYFKKDQKMATQWPVVKGTVELSVAITINNTSVPIIEVEKSLFVKQYVVPGVNTLEFTVKQCVCPYAFMMQLVMRQPVSKVTQDLFVRTQYNTLEICTQKFLTNYMKPPSLRLSLICAITTRRISIPTRSTQCHHPDCFDLEPFLIQQAENTYLQCPICQAIFNISDLEIDCFVGDILRKSTSQQVAEVIIEFNGEWRPAEMASQEILRKRQMDDNGPTHPIKRIKSEPFSHPGAVLSPFPPPNSVPVGVPFGHNCASSMLSPFAATTSPTKAVSSPSGARFIGGPDTPATPGHALNPSSVGHPPATTTESHVSNASSESVTQGTSPHQSHIQQHGSVEAPSLTGSAPYTPASVGSGGPAVMMNSVEPFNNIHSLSSASLDIDVLDGLGLFATAVMSTEDIRKYLNDSDTVFSTFDDLKFSNETVSLSGCTHAWEDIQSLIAADEKRV